LRETIGRQLKAEYDTSDPLHCCASCSGMKKNLSASLSLL